MEVDESTALSGVKEGKKYYFCSPGCREKFLATDSGGGSPMPKAQSPKKESDNVEHGTLNVEPRTDESPEACDIPLRGEQTEQVTKSVSLGITGMHCASCAANTEKALKKLDGVQSASVNIASESASVRRKYLLQTCKRRSPTPGTHLTSGRSRGRASS
jgi:hypothetical protein